MIKITFPDGAVKEFDAGITTAEIAASISKSLAKKALAGKVNGQLIDLNRGIEEDASIEIVTPDHEDALALVRHSTAHLMAQAMDAYTQISISVSDQQSIQDFTMTQTTVKTKSVPKIFQQSKQK